MRRKSKKMSQLNEWRVLLSDVRHLISSARNIAYRSVNTIQVLTNFKIGELIVKHEQRGKTRADYGKKVLENLSVHLTAEFGAGFSLTNLKLMRQFYLLKKLQMGQTASDQLLSIQKSHALSDQVKANNNAQAKMIFLSWSHYVFLLSIENEAERSFYEIEALQQNWSLRELKRQYNSSLYERIALSRNKKRVHELSQKGQIIQSSSDLIKQPYVLEFLGLDERHAYSESDLEAAIIDKLEKFLLELGKGYLFEARQKRFTIDGEHYFVDLVFYNRLLHSYVLLDLKIGKLTHQDIGQMQMYVNYYDRYVKTDDEHSTIGIILCKNKGSAVVKLTLPKDANIYASEYKLYLPSKQDLKKKLIEWAENETLSIK